MGVFFCHGQNPPLLLIIYVDIHYVNYTWESGVINKTVLVNIHKGSPRKEIFHSRQPLETLAD